jgi:hypothetical protein
MDLAPDHEPAVLRAEQGPLHASRLPKLLLNYTTFLPQINSSRSRLVLYICLDVARLS